MEPLVFGLDIGTRNVVGTVGYKEGTEFIVVAQYMKEHETRAMPVSYTNLELLEEVTAGLLFEEKQKKEAELLSRRQEQNYRRAGTLLETYLQRLRLEGSMDFETAFAKIKEWFEEENQKYLQMGQTAEQYLEYAFDFLDCLLYTSCNNPKLNTICTNYCV